TAIGVLGGRVRARAADGKPGTRPEHLHQFTSDRARLLSELVMARTVFLVGGAGTSLSLVARRSGVALRPLTITGIAVVAVASVLESVPRTVVARNPERWAPLLRPPTEALRALFLVPA